MASDNALFFRLAPEELANALTYIAMAGSVEAITTHAILLVEVVWQCIHVSVIGHRLVESGVEHAYLRNVGQKRCDCIHTLDVCRVVQRSEVVALSKSLHHFRRETNRFVELLAAMHHSVTYCIKLAKALQHGIIAVCQHFEDVLNACGMLLDGVLPLVLLAIQLDSYKRIGQTNLLNAATCNDGLVVHVVECIFNRTAAAVKNKNFHCYYLVYVTPPKGEQEGAFTLHPLPDRQ